MDQTLRQLGELLLGSIPTILLFLFAWGCYRVILHGPLERVLAERRERTIGASEKARADIARAEARTAEYEQRLREAKQAIFKAQEARRQKALEARAQVVAEARQRAAEMVREQRERMQQEKQAAQRSLQAEAERMAGEVIRAILKPVAMAQSPGGAR